MDDLLRDPILYIYIYIYIYVHIAVPSTKRRMFLEALSEASEQHGHARPPKWLSRVEREPQAPR